VPCLRIETDGAVSWLYESLDIIEYLRQQILTNRAAGKR
jgi:glutathione S-transferase